MVMTVMPAPRAPAPPATAPARANTSRCSVAVTCTSPPSECTDPHTAEAVPSGACAGSQATGTGVEAPNWSCVGVLAEEDPARLLLPFWPACATCSW